MKTSIASRDQAPAASGESAGALPLVCSRTYEQWWPFKRATWTSFDPEGPSTYPTWVPGFERETYECDVAFLFDGEGHELRTIVSIHVLPAPYKPRVFYRRQWRDPYGKLFGKARLDMCGEAAFRNWLAGKKVEFLLDARSEMRATDGYGHLIWPIVDANGFRVAS